MGRTSGRETIAETAGRNADEDCKPLTLFPYALDNTHPGPVVLMRNGYTRPFGLVASTASLSFSRVTYSLRDGLLDDRPHLSSVISPHLSAGDPKRLPRYRQNGLEGKSRLAYTHGAKPCRRGSQASGNLVLD